MKIRVTLIACLCALVPATALPQALTSLASVRVGYTTRKNTVNPQGELKAQIDALDAQIAEASRLGRNGELRRLYAKGVTLLAGRPWTDEADFAASLTIRTDRVVVVRAEAKPLGSASLGVAVRKGLDDVATHLETVAQKAPESLRAEILFPVDRIKNVNRGRLELRTFDPQKDLAAAETVAAAVE